MYTKMLKASDMAIIDWVDHNLPPYEVRDKYNPSWEAFKRQREQGIIRVFGGGARPDNTIFNTQEAIHCYRIWHDSMHLKYDLPFGGDYEITLSEKLEKEAIKLGIIPYDAILIRVDLFCHIKYYTVHREHPEYQRRLINDYLLQGDSVFFGKY